jgi:hypothetical protein
MEIPTFISTLILVALLTINSSYGQQVESSHRLKRGITWNGNWAFACDFRNNDLTNVRIRGEDCGGRCAQTAGCTHFTWTTYNGGTCWMKKGSVSKSDAFFTNDHSMVCGVIHPGSKSDGVAGRATRFWDCCKPSCGWSGKVPGSNAYVKSCSKDGYYAYGNSDVNNICIQGGPAYVCNNQKPWAVNDQLAYGFAAAHIPNQGEQDLCCNCYKLDFTSSPVIGKSMIVQVINTGADVGANQFDLQIPGGGVGMYNGCSSQWGASNNGWGQRYGGVGSRQECNALPKQIRDGCYFRFDWFKGADNPTMTYSKVKCPAELVAATGCSR